MKIGDKVFLLPPGEIIEFDEIGNIVVKWSNGFYGYYKENELGIYEDQSGTNQL